MIYGIFSDETLNYRQPLEVKSGDKIKIRIRIYKGLNPNFCICIVKDDIVKKYSMFFEKKDDFYEYYYYEFYVTEKELNYYFECKVDKEVIYYNKSGTVVEVDNSYNFGIYTDYSTPNWAKGAVLYQIFTDRFSNGDKSNDVLSDEYEYLGKKVRAVEWDVETQNPDYNVFHGGDIQGIIDKLDYLQELGINGIYLNPIFVSPSNHKYDTQDYENVDPHYGKIVVDDGTYKTRVLSKENLEASNKLFKDLVDELHRRGMHIITDGVFNHCGSFNKWMDSYNIYGTNTITDENAKYRDYFNFDEEGNYETWWGNETLPKLNFENSIELENKIIDIAKFWINDKYGIDGWRLDVAADLGHSEEYNHYFWKKFRNNVKNAKQECLILAEHYGDPKSWLDGSQWDSIMNYDAFMEPVSWFFTGVDKHSENYREDLYNNADLFWKSMRYHMSRFPIQSLMCSMNQLSNHDHSRFLTRTNKRLGRFEVLGGYSSECGIEKSVLMLATVFQMTWNGCPTLYYGDEVGLSGYRDPDNRRVYPWGREDNKLLEFFRNIISYRNINKDVFTYGSIIELYTDYGIISYARILNEKIIIVCINNNDYEVDFNLPIVYCLQKTENVIKEVFATTNSEYCVYKNLEQDMLVEDWKIYLQAKSCRIFEII